MKRVLSVKEQEASQTMGTLKAAYHRGFSRGLTLGLVLLAACIVLSGSLLYGEGIVDALFIDEKGNVGIGTDKPEATLDVNGELNVSGTAKAGKFEGDGAIPKGVIVMWSGEVDEIPEGWALCDGENGTPDLRGKFIRSAATPKEVNKSGGTTEHAHKASTTESSGTQNTAASWATKNYVSALTHTHPVQVEPAEHIPPYYNLVFIMKL